jgi:RNA polymerase sigma-70 factor (ECF subfamily)
METTVAEAPDQTWIEECQNGKRDAFEPLVRRYGPWAFRFALGMVRDEDVAKDLSQEAFIKAYRAIRTFDTARPFYPWLHQILRRLCLDHLRRKRPRVDVDELQERLPGFDGRQLIRSREREELRRLVHKALERLSPRDREILVLREFQESSYAEIALTLDIPRGTVMSRLYYARRRLRKELEHVLGARQESSRDGSQQMDEES